MGPSKGSSARSIAPSRSTKSTRSEIWAAAEMPSEVSTMQPSMTSMPWARAVWIICSARRIPPHLASLTFTPLTNPARTGTSLAVIALSSAITGIGNAASVALRRASGPVETGTGCSIMPTPISFSSVTTSTAPSGEKASLASTQRSASDDSLTARSVSMSFHPPTFTFSIWCSLSLLAVVACGRRFASARDAVFRHLEDYALEGVRRAAGDREGALGMHPHGLYARLQVRPPFHSIRDCIVAADVSFFLQQVLAFLVVVQEILKVVLGSGCLEKENGGTYGSGPVLVQRLGEHTAGPSHPSLRRGCEARDLRNMREGEERNDTWRKRDQLDSESWRRGTSRRAAA